MKFYCIGDEDAVWGFRLAGVEGRVVANPFEAKEALAVASASDEVSVVLITEAVAELIRGEVDFLVYKSGFPLVLEIPDASGPRPGRHSTSDLIRQAVGIAI